MGDASRVRAHFSRRVGRLVRGLRPGGNRRVGFRVAGERAEVGGRDGDVGRAGVGLRAGFEGGERHVGGEFLSGDFAAGRHRAHFGRRVGRLGGGLRPGGDGRVGFRVARQILALWLVRLGCSRLRKVRRAGVRLRKVRGSGVSFRQVRVGGRRLRQVRGRGRNGRQVRGCGKRDCQVGVGSIGFREVGGGCRGRLQVVAGRRLRQVGRARVRLRQVRGGGVRLREVRLRRVRLWQVGVGRERTQLLHGHRRRVLVGLVYHRRESRRRVLQSRRCRPYPGLFAVCRQVSRRRQRHFLHDVVYRGVKLDAVARLRPGYRVRHRHVVVVRILLPDRIDSDRRRRHRGRRHYR